MKIKQNAFKAYFLPILLLISITLGGITGFYFTNRVAWLKPFGTLFLNLLFTTIVPLIFFSVTSAIARIGSVKKLGEILSSMVLVFIVTTIIASCLAIMAIKCFPGPRNLTVPIINPDVLQKQDLFVKLIDIFSVSNFTNLFSHHNILALIVFSILVGLATTSIPEEKRKNVLDLLQAGEAIFMKVFSLIMYYAPIGFFAYFAVLVAELGPKLVDSYLHITLVYYAVALFYFIVVFTCFAYFAGKKQGVHLFWRNIFLPAITSIATCSSAASIPANLSATKAMQVPEEIYETTVPLGTVLHKEGSVIGGVMKIAFLFSLFHLDFSGASVLLVALGISLLVGTVMGAIPSGGMLGELLILNAYGFPPSSLMAIAAISIIIDPMATLLNVTGNSVSSMMIARLVGKKL